MDEFECLATHIVTLTEQNIFPMITVSRRSPPAFAAHLRARLNHTPFFLGQWGREPLCALLGLAEHIIVTADSVNMVGDVYQRRASASFCLNWQVAIANFALFTVTCRRRLTAVRGELDARLSNPANATPEIAAALRQAWDIKRAVLR